jgi:hypothetical protein
VGDIQLIVPDEVATSFGVHRNNVSLVTRKKLWLDFMEPPSGSTKRQGFSLFHGFILPQVVDVSGSDQAACSLAKDVDHVSNQRYMVNHK